MKWSPLAVVRGFSAPAASPEPCSSLRLLRTNLAPPLALSHACLIFLLDLCDDLLAVPFSPGFLLSSTQPLTFPESLYLQDEWTFHILENSAHTSVHHTCLYFPVDFFKNQLVWISQGKGPNLMHPVRGPSGCNFLETGILFTSHIPSVWLQALLIRDT